METGISVFNHKPYQRLPLEELPSHIGEFLDSVRSAKTHLVLRQELLEKKLSASEHFVDVEISKIHNVVGYFQDILNHAGVQDWRNAAEAIQKEGEVQAQSLQNSLLDIKKCIKESCDHVDHATTQMIKDHTKSLHNMRTGELEQLTEEGCCEIKTAANIASQKLNEISHSFHWKNLILIFFLFLFAVILTRLLI